MLHAPAAETVKHAPGPGVAAPSPAQLSHSREAAPRRCACGGVVGPDGECVACRARRLGRSLQTQLLVNRPGDVHEQAAERAAALVMRANAGRVVDARAATGAPPADTLAPPLVSQVLAAPGRPLDPGTRALMQARFGHDFGGVQVHTDAQANTSAEMMQAAAYTLGDQIVFGAGRYQPHTQTGKQLIAHELAHVVQQQGMEPSVQRAPLDLSDLDTSTAGLHQQAVADYAHATGAQPQPGAQYTQQYAAWLTRDADKIRFQPPTLVRTNPLDRINNGRINATTVLTINGAQYAAASSLGALSRQYVTAITPPSVTSTAQGTGVGCRFGDDFQIQTSALLTVNTAPGAQGWSKTLDPATILQPADQPRCAGKTAVAVTLRGQPTDQEYATLIENSEREHGRALENLHNKHFAPYYHFVRSLRATGTNNGDCETNLRQQIGLRAEQAALGFIFGDLAETARFDDPTVGTHHSRITPTIDTDCKSITLVANPTGQQQPGLDPGNVRTVAPVSTAIVAANLAVSGNDLTQGATTLRTFGSPVNANLALQVFQHYGITEILRIGSFEFLLAADSAPTGSLAGTNERTLDPDYYQVTFGVPDPTDWSIVEVVGDQVNLIHDFDANRDNAYSAVALMRRYGFNREVWIGPANNQELHFFRKD